MNKSILLLFVAICGLFASCAKKEEVSPYFFKCKINGTEYAINNDVGTYFTNLSSSQQIYGTEATDPNLKTARTMYIALELTKSVGVHTFNGANSIIFEDTDKARYRSNFNGGSGQIEITEKTAEVMKGKFSGTANTFTSPMKTIKITDGEFSVKFR